MKKLKKLSLVLPNLLPGIALAQIQDAPDIPIINASPNIEAVIIKIINIILGFSAALAVLFLIIGGIRYIISQGNAEAMESAKKTLLYAIIGLLVIVLSLVILNLVLNFGKNIAA